MEWKKFLRGSRRMLTGFSFLLCLWNSEMLRYATFGPFKLSTTKKKSLESILSLWTCVTFVDDLSFLQSMRSSCLWPLTALENCWMELFRYRKKISFLAQNFFLHFRNSLSTLRLLLLLFTREKVFFSLALVHSPLPIKLTFIWISSKIGDRDQIEEKAKNLCAKLNRIPRKEIFAFAVRLRWALETPKMSVLLYVKAFYGLSRADKKKWNLFTRWELWTRRRALLLNVKSQQVFVCASLQGATAK